MMGDLLITTYGEMRPSLRKSIKSPNDWKTRAFSQRSPSHVKEVFSKSRVQTQSRSKRSLGTAGGIWEKGIAVTTGV